MLYFLTSLNLCSNTSCEGEELISGVLEKHILLLESFKQIAHNLWLLLGLSCRIHICLIDDFGHSYLLFRSRKFGYYVFLVLSFSVLHLWWLQKSQIVVVLLRTTLFHNRVIQVLLLGPMSVNLGVRFLTAVLLWDSSSIQLVLRFPTLSISLSWALESLLHGLI